LLNRRNQYLILMQVGIFLFQATGHHFQHFALFQAA
jgi:hypothetical protein